MTDYPDWTVPQANASAISTTGAPLLRLTSTLGQAQAQNLPANASTTILAKTALNQPSIEAMFTLNLPAGFGTVPFAQFLFNWFDSLTGLNIDSEFYELTSGNGIGGALTYYLTGPARGDQLQVQVLNQDPSVAMTLSWVINAVSHLYEHDRLLQPFIVTTAPIGFTNPGGNPALGVLAASKPAIAANATAPRLAAIWNGRAVLSVDNTGQVNTCLVQVADPGTLYSINSQQSLVSVSAAAGATVNADIALPNGPVNLLIQNKGASGSITPSVTLIKREF